MLCTNCGKETKNPKYCSRSCSATITGSLFPKRIPAIKSCDKCENTFRGRNKYCSSCRGTKEQKISHYKSLTKGEYNQRNSVVGQPKHWANMHLRQFNRIWNKSMTLEGCRNCGYSIFVELAHIKPVSGFPPEATLGEINDPSNVLPLCRNCHWEFDHGMLPGLS